jgi:iron(III) transport system permease protein
LPKRNFSLPSFDSKTTVILLCVALLLIFTALPLLYLAASSFMSGGSFDFSNYKDVYSRSVNWRALLNTLKLSFATMVSSVLLTFPLAWLIGRTNLPGRGGFRTWLVATYMIPPYVGAIAWVQLLNPSVGYLNMVLKWAFGLDASPFDIYTMGGLTWVLTLFYSPFAFIAISRAMEKMDPALEEAARIAGASPLRTLRDVTMPLMAPSILAGGLLVFISAASCFGIPSIVGMPSNIEVMTTRIVTYVYMGDSKGIRDATALATILMLLANALLLAMGRFAGQKDYTTIGGKSTRPNIVNLGAWRWPALAAVGFYTAVAVALPLGSILLTSLIGTMSKPIGLDNLTFENWKPVIASDQYLAPIFNSLQYGVAAATVGTLLAVFISYLLVKTTARGRQLPDLLVTAGGAAPSIVIALALIIAFSGKFVVNLYSTAGILVAAYLVKYMTMAVRTISASLVQVHSSLEEAALSSGAGWLRACRDIILPLIAPSVVAGWFLIFMPSFYELTMSILLYGSETKTIGVLLYELQTYADTQNASVLSVIILAIVLIGNIILNKASKGSIGI